MEPSAGSSPAAQLKEGRGRQCADAVLMIEPGAFGYNPDTARTNTFQRSESAGAEAARAEALAEFARLRRALESEGVEVCAVEDTASPPKPDAVFPNNWLSFHEDGTLVLYPLESASRRFDSVGVLPSVMMGSATRRSSFALGSVVRIASCVSSELVMLRSMATRWLLVRLSLRSP